MTKYPKVGPLLIFSISLAPYNVKRQVVVSFVFADVGQGFERDLMWKALIYLSLRHTGAGGTCPGRICPHKMNSNVSAFVSLYKFSPQ